MGSRRYSDQFKAEAVALVLEVKRPIAQVARELGVNEGALGNWVTQWRRENPQPEPELSPTERVKVREMEAEMRRLRMENEFLKKPRPSSQRHNRSRTLRVDRSGEG